MTDIEKKTPKEQQQQQQKKILRKEILIYFFKPLKHAQTFVFVCQSNKSRNKETVSVLLSRETLMKTLSFISRHGLRVLQRRPNTRKGQI